MGDANVTLRRLCRGDETKAGSSIAMLLVRSGVLNFARMSAPEWIRSTDALYNSLFSGVGVSSMVRSMVTGSVRGVDSNIGRVDWLMIEVQFVPVKTT